LFHTPWSGSRTAGKDGRTALAYKAENAVDMESRAIIAVTTHGGGAVDTATVEATVIEAGAAVAQLVTAEPPEGKYQVHPGGVEEVVADKGYHSNEVIVGLTELKVRTYIAEPDRGARNWEGKPSEKEAVCGNRRRIRGKRGKRMQRQRGENIERNFAHQFDTGGMDRLYVPGIENVHKKLLVQAAACNLALLMRSMHGAGKPRAASYPNRASQSVSHAGQQRLSLGFRDLADVDVPEAHFGAMRLQFDRSRRKHRLSAIEEVIEYLAHHNVLPVQRDPHTRAHHFDGHDVPLPDRLIRFDQRPFPRVVGIIIP
jgi:hypothetical protein